MHKLGNAQYVIQLLLIIRSLVVARVWQRTFDVSARVRDENTE